MSHLESGSVVWVRLGQAWWPGTITTIAKCPPEFVQAIRKTPIAIVKFFHENEYQDVHKAEHIFPYNCDRKEEFIRKGQAVNKNQSHGDVDLLAKFEADVVTAEKLTGGDMDILRTLVEGADTYKAFHTSHCPPSSPRHDSNYMVISGQPSQPPLDPHCPAGVEFESRPQENLWPERVEAHTRLGCNSSKVRNPQNCQAAASDHQIASMSRNSLSPLADGAGRDGSHAGKARPHLGGKTVLTGHCGEDGEENEREDESSASRRSLGVSQSSHESLEERPAGNEETTEDGNDEEEEEEDEEETEDESLNNEPISESEKLAESVDEDSLNLELETEGEGDDADPRQLISEGEGEALETDSDTDFLLEAEDEEDGSLALPGTEQETPAGSADDNEDSLIPDLVSEEEDASEKADQHRLSPSWETDDDDDSEEELYRNLPSASATDEEEAVWMHSAVGRQGKGGNEAVTSTRLKEAAEARKSPNRDKAQKDRSREVVSVCKEGKGEKVCVEERTQDFLTCNALQKPSRHSRAASPEPVVQQTHCTPHPDSEEEEEEEEEESTREHNPSNLTGRSSSGRSSASPKKHRIQESEEPPAVDPSVSGGPSTSRSPDISLTFEGFDREKTKQASDRLLLLLKATTEFGPQRKGQGAKAEGVSRRGRPPLRGRTTEHQGGRTCRTSLSRKRNQLHVSASATTPMTSDTEEEREEEEEEVEGGRQRSTRGRGGRGGSAWVKHRYGRGRQGNRKLRHSPLRRKTIHRHHKNTETSLDRRKTRSSGKEEREKEKEREKETEKEASKPKPSYERYTHSPDITAYSEAPPRPPRNWEGTREKENRVVGPPAPEDPPAKRPRKRKPSEVDNLLKWAVETGHTGSRSRLSRERHYSPSVTGTSTTSNNNNNNNNTASRRSRLEGRTANKTQKKRGRKRKVRRNTEEEKEEETKGQAHANSSSDDWFIDSEEGESSDVSKAPAPGRGRPAFPYKSGDLVWVQVEKQWWPGYVDQAYPQTKRVSVYRVGLKQEASTKVELPRVRTFLYGEVPDFVDRSESGFTEALQVTESFCLLRNHGNKISSHKFFTMPPEEQDALIIVSFTPKDDPGLTSPQGKRTRGQAREEQQHHQQEQQQHQQQQHQQQHQQGWCYESLNSDTEDEVVEHGEDKYMSARERRRIQKALRSRRRENEKLAKYMKSAACMKHLWQIFSGQKHCERHKLYQSEATRRSLLLSGIGPFQLDEDDDQILSIVDFLHTEMNKKQPDFNLAQDYVFKVWMPEGIKEALRVVFKVTEDMLELALDAGYWENLTERKTRRFDFV